MRAVRYHEHGDESVLQVDEIDRPEPGGHELLVRVRAAGVNPVDTYFREGSYEPYTLPMIPGSELAGEVVATGEGTPGFAAGDRVYATGLGSDHQGTYAEYATVPIDRAAILPADVPYEVGGAIALAGGTAWRALIDHAGLEPAEMALIHGASGGVGHAAVQLAAAAGATVVGTAAPDYHSALRDMGADHVYDYSRDDLAAVVGDHEPSVVLDHKLDSYLQFDATVADTGARVVGIGNDVPEAGFDNIALARGKEINLTLMSLFNTPSLADLLDRLAVLLESEAVTAEIAETYDLDAAAAAHRSVMEDSFLGKLAIVP